MTGAMPKRADRMVYVSGGQQGHRRADRVQHCSFTVMQLMWNITVLQLAAAW